VAENRAARVEEVCRESGAIDLLRVVIPEEAEVIWNSRKWFFAGMEGRGPAAILADVWVPRSKAPDLVSAVERIGEKEGLVVALSGHVGEGRLHPTVLQDPEDSSQVSRVAGALEEIYGRAISLGGTVAPPRGTGCGKVPVDLARHAARELDWVRQLKDVFDPRGIMNPGKLS
jgi:glycolate oxidase